MLLDIEGTTTPISFVYQVLFPFAHQRIGAFLRAHQNEPDVAAALLALRAERQADDDQGLHPPWWQEEPEEARLASATAYLRWLMDQDRKSTPLKTLQGRIWQAGYESGALRGQVFPDVPPAFKRWTQQGRHIALYSSGSVLAQELLFAHSTAGDFTPFIGAYFDTTTGPKKQAESYARIATTLGCPPGGIVFVSDSLEELEAARAAGLEAVLSVRPGNAPVPAGHGFAALTSFDELFSR